MVAALLIVAIGGSSPFPLHIDDGACPGECCSYGHWRLDSTAQVRAAPRMNSEVTGEIQSGTEIVAETGEVHTKPGRFSVRREHGRYELNDILWVLTYLGEGHFRVWYQDRISVEDLGFSPWGGGAGKRCEQPEGDCWGELSQELEFIWWVKVRTPGALEGWISNPADYQDFDPLCGL